MPKNKKQPPIAVSQNFLTSTKTICRLLDAAQISPSDTVLEIGPGKGHITRQLLERCGRLQCAELDAALCSRLTELFGNDPKFSLFQGDFFTMTLPKGPYKVFSNIPFSRTTDIIRRLTLARHSPEAAWLLVERGAAMRFSGAFGETLASLSLKPFFDLRICAYVGRESFHPMPRTDAALLELVRKDPADLPINQRELYLQFLRRAWTKGMKGLLTKRQVSTALRLAGLPSPGRDALMEYVQWLCLFRCWQAKGLHQ